MSFQDWISQDPSDDPPGDRDEPAWAFAHSARARAQAERESNRSRRRHTWRARAVLARRALARKDPDAGS
jgi:hypothetical protein